jgi:hypothetical protein
VRARLAPDARKRYRNQNAEDLRHGVEMYTERLTLLTAREQELNEALAKEERGGKAAIVSYVWRGVVQSNERARAHATPYANLKAPCTRGLRPRHK